MPITNNCFRAVKEISVRINENSYAPCLLSSLLLPAWVKVASAESACELQICLEPQKKKKTNRTRSIYIFL